MNHPSQAIVLFALAADAKLTDGGLASGDLAGVPGRADDGVIFCFADRQRGSRAAARVCFGATDARGRRKVGLAT